MDKDTVAKTSNCWEKQVQMEGKWMETNNERVQEQFEDFRRSRGRLQQRRVSIEMEKSSVRLNNIFKVENISPVSIVYL